MRTNTGVFFDHLVIDNELLLIKMIDRVEEENRQVEGEPMGGMYQNPGEWLKAAKEIICAIYMKNGQRICVDKKWYAFLNCILGDKKRIDLRLLEVNQG